MSPPPVLTIEDRQCFPFRQVFWLWDDLTPDPFPPGYFIRRVVWSVSHPITAAGPLPIYTGFPFQSRHDVGIT